MDYKLEGKLKVKVVAAQEAAKNLGKKPNYATYGYLLKMEVSDGFIANRKREELANPSKELAKYAKNINLPYSTAKRWVDARMKQFISLDLFEIDESSTVDMTLVAKYCPEKFILKV